MRCKGMLFCSSADTKGTTPRIYLSGKCLHTPSKLGNRCAVAHAPHSLLPACSCRALRPGQAQQRADPSTGIGGCWACCVPPRGSRAADKCDQLPPPHLPLTCTLPTPEYQIIHAGHAAIAAPQFAGSIEVPSGSRPDPLTASAPVLDRYCFTLNFGHATGPSTHAMCQQATYPSS